MKPKFTSRKKWFLRMAVVLFVFITSGFLYLKFTHQLSPGPLADYRPKNRPLNGAVSHADLNAKCTHCHAPIHCIEDTRCQDCHFEIAQDRLDTNTLHGRLPGVSRCQNCHPEHQGEDASLLQFTYENIDHYALSGFSIATHVENFDGTDFTCGSCHSQVGSILETMDCATCHSGEDHDAMAVHIEEYGPACVECHDGKDRMVAGFEHGPAFQLQGGHADLECAACHTEQHYVGQAAECGACHADPELHAGVFGSDCARCHSVTAWAPAELKEHTFNAQYGAESIHDCENCHAGTYNSHPCASCHEDEEMETVHLQEGIQEYAVCLDCHPTGRGSEAAMQQGDLNQTPQMNQGTNGYQPGPENQEQFEPTPRGNPKH